MHTRWLGPGLFFATLSTLLLETLDARLLSVLTWYHLSFFAVSLAMLGMAGGAVFVFLHPAAFSPDRAPRSLARATLAFALAVPISHLFTLVMPFVPITDANVMEILSISAFTVVLAVPFVLSGVVVTTALTRCGGAIGRLYACDLIGAALGCVLVVPMLERTNVSSSIFLAGASAAIAAVCFARLAGTSRVTGRVVLAAALVGIALLNNGSREALAIIYPKNRQLWLLNKLNDITRWNSHSYVLVQRPGDGNAFLWGPGIGADQFKARIAWLAIDGEAGSPITQWDGRRESLEWVSYDVTTLPYSLRRGDVAVIGVGGGRDILAALWGQNRSIVGIDVNRIMIDLLTTSHRDFANIANQPNVALVHDDGRAYLTRTDRRFDIIQISLVDTWASTGAGAFALSENGLYTVEGWRVFLDRLKPGGVLSVSRWFDPHNVSETRRLVALGVGALLDRHVARPSDHLILAVREKIATLMVSTAPFTDADRARLTAVMAPKGFELAVSPWTPATGGPVIDRIAHSTSQDELRRAIADPLYDYSPPTDARPYYFNMLKPRALWSGASLPREGALGGNLRATLLLLILLGVTTVLVGLIIIWPLAAAGRPAMSVGRFATTMAYFAIIGFGFMLIQVGLLQRFSVYLGHPTYTLAIVLFAMLLFTGLGSLLSERLTIAPGRRLSLVPAAIGLVLVLIALLLPRTIAATIGHGLPARTAIVVLFAAPLSLLLGMCFPIGVRLSASTPSVIAWAWGVNGAFGVLASILAVALSIWVGIDANFWVAAALYISLGLPLASMRRTTLPR
ncbi:MAG TPA: class I SAM-dependent methyltransferase [Vicinamibacterales bacterium]|jgi:SAM-dependent methyltransferase|nr:class I SAM-dependent methyltransferase [Vicinamibacterales bacterium]